VESVLTAASTEKLNFLAANHASRFKQVGIQRQQPAAVRLDHRLLCWHPSISTGTGSS
jgi:hypothetical protein